jgi:very-short-patch-repair endonuclease
MLNKKEKKIQFTVKEIKKILDLLNSKEIERVKKILKKKLPKVKVVNGLVFKTPNEAANHYKDELIKNQTEAEKVFKALLKSINLDYEFQKIFWYRKDKLDKFYIVDFYIPSLNIVIEIDGEYHNTKDQQKNDRLRSGIIKNNGVFKVFRFSNYEVINESESTILRLGYLIDNILNEESKHVTIDGIKYKSRKSRK